MIPIQICCHSLFQKHEHFWTWITLTIYKPFLWNQPIIAFHKALDIFKNPSSVKQFTKSSTPFATSHDFIRIQYSIDIRWSTHTVIRSRQLNLLSSGHLSTALKNAQEGFLTDHYTSSDQHNSQHATYLNINESSLRVNALERSLSTALLSTFDSLALLESIKINPKFKPWVTQDILNTMKRRDAAYQVSLATNSPVDHAIYKQLRNNVSNSLCTAKNKYTVDKLRSGVDPQSSSHELSNLGLTMKRLPSQFKFFTPTFLNSHFANTTYTQIWLYESHYAGDTQRHYHLDVWKGWFRRHFKQDAQTFITPLSSTCHSSS